jgi:protein-tyrosine kinase
MSRLFEALKQMERERRSPSASAVAREPRTVEFLTDVLTEKRRTDERFSTRVEFSPSPRLVALTDRDSLGAEKFRALATRLENLRRQREIKSIQVTSSSVGEGKTVVSGNLAATLAHHSGSRVLLVEGDLHRPALTSLFGAPPLHGIGDWWSAPNGDMADFVHKMKDFPLWFISAGPCDQSSQILKSSRFTEAFARLSDAFDWVVVDSAPMLPTITANLWARLVDGTVLVVREGVASVKDLKKGMEALDNPKLIGIVLNEASELREANYPNPDKREKRK